MKVFLQEITRMDMINAAKRLSPDRFARRLNYNTRGFKDVDFQKLFETDTFLWYAGVGDHVVIVEFEGAFEDLKWLVSGMRGPNRVKRVTVDIVAKALSKSLDENDLRVACSCEDWKYRLRYYAVKKDFSADPASQNFNYRPRYTKTNKEDNKGYVCKHILAVLFGKRWVQSAAKAWVEWMRANPKTTEEYLWGKEYKPEEDEE